MDMGIEIMHNGFVGIDDFVQTFRGNLISEPGGSRSNHALCAELIRIGQVPTERFGIIGLIGDVC